MDDVHGRASVSTGGHDDDLPDEHETTASVDGGWKHQRQQQSTAADFLALRPSGAFLSTVLDLATWDSLLYTDRILTQATRRVDVDAVRLNDGATHPYGLGWHVDSTKNGKRVWHGGGLPGFVSHFVRYLDHGLSVSR